MAVFGKVTVKIRMAVSIDLGSDSSSMALFCSICTLVDVLVIVLSRFLTFLIDPARFFFILESRQESVLDFTARILPDFQEYKILDRTDKSCLASQDCIYMILG
jgi:hypothetical protein